MSKNTAGPMRDFLGRLAAPLLQKLGWDGEGITEPDSAPLWIAVDFDETIALHYDSADPLSPLQLLPGVYEGLSSLKRAGHKLLLFSGRANRGNREDPYLNPLIRNGSLTLDLDKWTANQPMYQARYEQMVEFVEKLLPGIFDGIDDGRQGKPTVDLFIDDRASRFKVKNPEKSWRKIAKRYGR